MAMDTSKLHLPKTVATAVVNKVKETSTIAALSPSSPQIFTDKEYMIFNGAAEADVTAEGQTKSSYEQDLNYVSGKTFKVQTNRLPARTQGLLLVVQSRALHILIEA